VGNVLPIYVCLSGFVYVVGVCAARQRTQCSSAFMRMRNQSCPEFFFFFFCGSVEFREVIRSARFAHYADEWRPVHAQLSLWAVGGGVAKQFRQRRVRRRCRHVARHSARQRVVSPSCYHAQRHARPLPKRAKRHAARSRQQKCVGEWEEMLARASWRRVRLQRCARPSGRW